jgi:hypothetical protein
MQALVNSKFPQFGRRALRFDSLFLPARFPRVRVFFVRTETISNEVRRTPQAACPA